MHQPLPPTQLAALLQQAAPDQREHVLHGLRRAKLATLWALRRQKMLRLSCVEQGWEDYWLLVHQRTTDTLADIERVLATC